MSYPAALPVLREEWGLSATAAGFISTSFQLTFTLSLVISSWLSDRVGARRVFLWSSFFSTVAAFLVPLAAQGYRSGLLLFTLLALASGGTYTPGLMLVADRISPERRGRAMGWFLAAASLGYACSLMITGLLVSEFGWRSALIGIAIGSLLGAVLALWTLSRSPVDAPLSGDARSHGGVRFKDTVLTSRPVLLLLVGYTFHSWELLGMWAWTPAFLTAVLGDDQVIERAAGYGAGLTALFHMMGLLAASVSGWLSDRWGRTGVIILMMSISSLCSLTFGWLVNAPLFLVLLVGFIYSFAAIGDSPVYSTALTEVVQPAYLGSALAIRSLVGFGVGSLSSVAFGKVLDLTNPHTASHQSLTWGWAYSVLGLGAALGLCSVVWLRRMPQSWQMANGKR